MVAAAAGATARRRATGGGGARPVAPAWRRARPSSACDAWLRDGAVCRWSDPSAALQVARRSVYRRAIRPGCCSASVADPPPSFPRPGHPPATRARTCPKVFGMHGATSCCSSAWGASSAFRPAAIAKASLPCAGRMPRTRTASCRPGDGGSRRTPRRSVGKFCNIALAQSRSPRYDARPRTGTAALRSGRVAQLVEQGIENPRVGGSIPSSATILSGLAAMQALFFCPCVSRPLWSVYVAGLAGRACHATSHGRRHPASVPIPGAMQTSACVPLPRPVRWRPPAPIACEEGVSTSVDKCSRFAAFR